MRLGLCVLIASAAAAGLAACDGDGSEDTSLAALCSEAYSPLLDKVFECNPQFGLVVRVVLDGQAPSAAEFTEQCKSAFQPFLDDGTVELGDATAIETCKQYIAENACFDLDEGNPCEDVFVGKVALGQPCDDDIQCAGDAHCDKPSETGCGTCTALKANGIACVDQDECMGHNCSDGVCADLAGPGESCDDDSNCAGVLTCTAGICAEADTSWTRGDPCQDLFDCNLGSGDLACNIFAASPTCQPFKALGETCGPGAMGGVCRILEHQHCRVEGMTATCAMNSVAAIGETCDFDQGIDCPVGARCVDHDGNAQTPSQCMQVLPEGGACSVDEQCPILYECIGGKCQAGNHTGMCPAPTS